MTASPVARKVLALPYRERERLLVELLDSLDDGDVGEVEAGNVATVPADQPTLGEPSPSPQGSQRELDAALSLACSPAAPWPSTHGLGSASRLEPVLGPAMRRVAARPAVSLARSPAAAPAARG